MLISCPSPVPGNDLFNVSHKKIMCANKVNGVYSFEF